jgi:rhodanese-related sulfurtransferase
VYTSHPMNFTEKLLHFVENHWLLWLALVVVLLSLVFEEFRDKLSGVPRLSPQELTQMMNRGEVVVVDMRDTNAFTSGHIISSINIPAAEVASRLVSLDKYKDKALVLVDGGAQNIAAVAKLRSQGFKLYGLAGGINAWRTASLPLSKK